MYQPILHVSLKLSYQSFELLLVSVPSGIGKTFSLSRDDVGDNPDLAVLSCVVAGEEAANTVSGGQVIGGLVPWAGSTQ
jgi:hypothetical protein